jgi:assimilatory nitrate reductase catalytic subunit
VSSIRASAEGSGNAASVDTHCPYCSLQCGITLTQGESGLTVTPQADFPTNLGGLCAKGFTAAELLDHPDRITTPLVRDSRGDAFRPASWEEALERMAEAFLRAQARRGRDGVALFGGGGLTNEKAYQFGKFARASLRTSLIDYNGRFCMSSAANAAIRAFGIDRGLPFPLADIASADAVLLVGSNMADTMPPAMQFLEQGRERGARHIVVDPRRTMTARAATLHLQPVPGTDLALALGLLNVAIREKLVDEEFIADRTTGFEAVRRAARMWWPDRVERVSGVPERALVQAVRILADASSAMILTARGAEQHRSGSDTAVGFINVALALGLPGRRYSGYGTITGQGNGQGGREHGQKADQLPGYRMLTDPVARKHVAGVWGMDPDDLPGPGLSAYELLDRLGTDEGPEAMWVVASNVAVSAPRALHVIERLRSLEFLAVSDIFLSETAELADVVLPTTQFAEESGTMTNLEGRVIRRRQAVDAPPEVRSDLWVMARLSERLGGVRLDDDPAVVFEELRRASKGGKADYWGITYDRIDAEQGVFWPCPSTIHPGTPRLFEDDFRTPDRRAHFHVVAPIGPAETPDDDYPYYLTTGRLLRQYQSGTQTRRVAALADAEPVQRVEMHPQLAARLGVVEGAPVRLSSRRGTAQMRVRISADIRPDTVFAAFHRGGSAAVNNLTNPALDPYSRMPEFKACAVAIEPIGPGTDPFAATQKPMTSQEPVDKERYTDA